MALSKKEKDLFDLLLDVIGCKQKDKDVALVEFFRGGEREAAITIIEKDEEGDVLFRPIAKLI